MKESSNQALIESEVVVVDAEVEAESVGKVNGTMVLAGSAVLESGVARKQ